VGSKMQEVRGLSTNAGPYRSAVRLFGGLNIAFCSIGLILEAQMLVGFLRGGERILPGVSSRIPFYSVTIISIILLSALLKGSVDLIRLRRRGLAICGFAFLAELLYGFALIEGWLHLNHERSPLGESFTAAFALGNVGMAPQLVLFYPLIGLCAVFFLARKSKQIQWRSN
jgi:hypothetical protein